MPILMKPLFDETCNESTNPDVTLPPDAIENPTEAVEMVTSDTYNNEIETQTFCYACRQPYTEPEKVPVEVEEDF